MSDLNVIDSRPTPTPWPPPPELSAAAAPAAAPTYDPIPRPLPTPAADAAGLPAADGSLLDWAASLPSLGSLLFGAAAEGWKVGAEGAAPGAAKVAADHLADLGRWGSRLSAVGDGLAIAQALQGDQPVHDLAVHAAGRGGSWGGMLFGAEAGALVCGASGVGTAATPVCALAGGLVGGIAGEQAARGAVDYTLDRLEQAWHESAADTVDWAGRKVDAALDRAVDLVADTTEYVVDRLVGDSLEYLRDKIRPAPRLWW